jgi:triosephosphate isomerase
MNNGPTAARAFIAAFTARWAPRDDRSVIFFPPALSVSTVINALGSRTDLGVGVQNIWTEDKGAFTGETSAPMAKDAGARFVLVGHSERRHVFGETDAETALKCAASVRSGLTPILCVGELLRQRESGDTNNVVLAQLSRRIEFARGPTSFRRWRSHMSRCGRSERERRRHRTTQQRCMRSFAAHCAN